MKLTAAQTRYVHAMYRAIKLDAPPETDAHKIALATQAHANEPHYCWAGCWLARGLAWPPVPQRAGQLTSWDRPADSELDDPRVEQAERGAFGIDVRGPQL